MIKLVEENELHQWVSGHSREAQGEIVDLIYRLVLLSSPQPKQFRFPQSDSIGQPGRDGVLEAVVDFEPYIPLGLSCWEIGTGNNPAKKCKDDYKKRTESTAEEERKKTTFIFVTPLSGLHSWSEPDQTTWLNEVKPSQDWKDVRIIDGTKLVSWIQRFYGVGIWLKQQITSFHLDGIESVESRWSDLESIGKPPPLTPNLFLENREDFCAKLKQLLDGDLNHIKIATHYQEQASNAVCAYLAALEGDARISALSRCLFISNTAGWIAACSFNEKLVLIADSSLDLSGDEGVRLIQKARKANHSVILSGPRGAGAPEPHAVDLGTPRIHQIEEALKKAGYQPERARTLAQKCSGDLGSLLRCIQGMSTMPEWAERSEAAELAVAMCLGQWNENKDADKRAVEAISGKAYGEWIKQIREITHASSTPLHHRDGIWRFRGRYEAWYAIGPRLFDENLDRLKNTIVATLTVADPKFDLPSKDRFAANIHGKVLPHSRALREGMAETLALLGSHPDALKSCSSGRAELTAQLIVRDLLEEADWRRWASLDPLLPLLAEAAPTVFLDQVEAALNKEACPFDELFRQEGDGFHDGTHISGLLWALETLAWDRTHLTRVTLCLGGLAHRDPGGKWANRPANSLRSIYLPWLPQTTASLDVRFAAIRALTGEELDVAWKLLLALLPETHSSSSHTRRPAWRASIPDDWRDGVATEDYSRQVMTYAEMTVEIATKNFGKMLELLPQLDHLPKSAFEKFIAHLKRGPTHLGIAEEEKILVWNTLSDFIRRHRKFSEAAWALPEEALKLLDSALTLYQPLSKLEPFKKLFSDREFDFYDADGDFESQRKNLDLKRQQIVAEISQHSLQPLLDFSLTVDSPWRAGTAFGIIAPHQADKELLPFLLGHPDNRLKKFVGGFIAGRFHQFGWQWADAVDTNTWSKDDVSHFLRCLPFNHETWDRAYWVLQADHLTYWQLVDSNPYLVKSGLEYAIEKFLEVGRPNVAVGCLYRMIHNKQAVSASLIIRSLLAASKTKEPVGSFDVHAIEDLIATLQKSPEADPEQAALVEWAYLPLLDRISRIKPKFLSDRLASNPEFFSEAICMVYRARNSPKEESTDERKAALAENAYRLLDAWQIPPGRLSDGTFDEAVFTSWVDKAKALCTESGRFEVGMITLGHVLIYSPPDPSGLWIHKSVANVLNGKDAEDIRSGFRTALFNSRGVFSYSKGEQERKLAAGYSAQADSLDQAGFPRFAGTLRDLATSYEREAEKQSKRDFND